MFFVFFAILCLVAISFNAARTRIRVLRQPITVYSATITHSLYLITATYWRSNNLTLNIFFNIDPLESMIKMVSIEAAIQKKKKKFHRMS